MCGIAGYLGPTNLSPTSDQIKSCINLMKRRGPDFQNLIKKKIGNNELVMLHSRLSIIDPVKKSNQPMEDHNGIISKGRSLKGILEPFSTKGNLDLLRRAGFKDINSIRCLTGGD